MVATYSNNGWTMYTTNAEAARQTEMCMIYNEAASVLFAITYIPLMAKFFAVIAEKDA